MKEILVVDDHPAFLTFISDLLKNKGHRVIKADDGLSALEILKRYTPDVIFTDLVMPNIDGEKLIRIIRRMPKMKDAVLILISGIAAEEYMELGALGADACISKGPMDKMGKNILDAMDRFDKGTPKGLSEKVIGLEDVRKREIIKELLSSQRHFELIFNSMSEGILELTPEGKIIYANPAGISMAGVCEEALLGTSFTSLFDEAQQKVLEPLFETTGESPSDMTVEHPLRINDKQITVNLLKVKDNAHQTIVVILNDVDQRVRMEEQLRQAQRMEAVGALAGGIAHEFNNALAGVSGNIELLRMDLSETDKIDEYIEAINRSVRHMADLTAQLLAYARGGKYQSRNMSVIDFLKHELAFFLNSLSPSIQADVDLPDDVLYINGDATQLQMVLSAVLHNASEAIEGEGHIRITVKKEEIDDNSSKANPDLKTGPFVCLTIEDDGKGMDDLVRQKIFEPFYTTKFLGRGLGMAAAHGIIKNHDGSIFIDTEQGKGTRVKIYLPEVEAKPKATKNHKNELYIGDGTVLLIEDEASVMKVIQAMLEKLGCQAIGAKNGNDAVKIVKNMGDAIDIALLDIKLPDMEGFKLYFLIKEACPKIKVMICSGYPLDGPTQEIIDAGAQDFIQKPFSLTVLSEKLKRLLKSKPEN